jgi:hypothetical protein
MHCIQYDCTRRRLVRRPRAAYCTYCIVPNLPTLTTLLSAWWRWRSRHHHSFFACRIKGFVGLVPHNHVQDHVHIEDFILQSWLTLTYFQITRSRSHVAELYCKK